MEDFAFPAGAATPSRLYFLIANVSRIAYRFHCEEPENTKVTSKYNNEMKKFHFEAFGTLHVLGKYLTLS